MTGLHCGTNPAAPKKKNRGLMQTLYAAFFGGGHTDSTAKKPKSATSPAASAGTICMIVSSIRPLHIADGGSQSPPPPPPPLPPTSPSPASSVTGSKSSYASADFGDKVSELDDEIKTGETGEGEAEIDVILKEEAEEVVGGKAEMIIGKFYQQIRLQALKSIGIARSSTSF